MQQDEDRKQRSVMTKLEWGVVFSVIASAASIVFSAGVIWTTVQSHEKDIVALKSKALGDADRLARIETKLDIILSDRGGGQ